MNTLYIIGNGFDLHHKLPTSYDGFYRYIQANNSELFDTFEEYFSFRTGANLCWSNFEDDLSTFDWKSFFDNHNNVELSADDISWSSTFGLTDELKETAEQIISDIREEFANWLQTIDIESARKRLRLNRNGFFLSFNYTLTLEKIYGIKKDRVFHIHSDLHDTSGDLVFGHNAVFEHEPELDEYGASNRTMFTDAESEAKTILYQFLKPVKEIISQNTDVFHSFRDMSEIIVLEHSLNKTDVPYIEEIFKRSKNANWKVSYYQAGEEKMFRSSLEKIGVPSRCITFIRLDDPTTQL